MYDSEHSRTAYLPHPDFFIDVLPLTLCDSFRILGVIFDSRFTFGQLDNYFVRFLLQLHRRLVY